VEAVASELWNLWLVKIYRSRQKGVEEVIGVGVFESTRFFTLALYYERVYQTAVYLTSSKSFMYLYSRHNELKQSDHSKF